MVCVSSLANVGQEHLRLKHNWELLSLLSHEKATAEQYSIHCYQKNMVYKIQLRLAKVFEGKSSMSWVSESCHVTCQQNVRISLFLLDSCLTQRLADSGRRHILTAAALLHHLWEVKLTTNNTHVFPFIYRKVPSWTCQVIALPIKVTLCLLVFFFRLRSLPSTWIPMLMAELTSKISVMECLQSKVRGRFPWTAFHAHIYHWWIWSH